MFAKTTVLYAQYEGVTPPYDFPVWWDAMGGFSEGVWTVAENTVTGAVELVRDPGAAVEGVKETLLTSEGRSQLVLAMTTAAKQAYDDLTKGDAEAKGKVIGTITMEIVLVVISAKGVDKLAKAGKASKLTKVIKGSKAVGKFKEATENSVIINKMRKAVTSVQGAGKAVTATTQASVKKKLKDYLLNPNHPVGKSKAKWFKEALGFTQENRKALAKQVVFDSKKAVQTAVTEYGIKYNQVIKITGANGKVIDVTFAWIKNNDGVVRLVTAIPTPK